MTRVRPRHLPIALSALLAPSWGAAQVRGHIQGHAATVVDGWQSDAFGPGGGGGATLEYALHPAFGVTIGGGYTALSRGDGALPAGVARPAAGGYGVALAGVRVRPLARRGLAGERLWIAVEGGAGFTGDVVRPALAASVGYAFPLGGVASLGPWVGFATLLQTDAQDLADDARVVLGGLSFTLGGERAPAPRLARSRPAPPRPRCAAVHGDALPDADGDGCPESDTDRDGIADPVDRCPGTPEDADGFEDRDGCPDPDNDQDGILDPADACPNEAEVVNGVDDGDGCPDHAEARVEHGHIVLEERVHFEYDSARLRGDSRSALVAVARIMAAHPEYRALSVEGHADDRGGDQYNDALSLHRAQAVADAVVAAGVPRERVRALGFGRRLPRAVGGTDDARAQNRRVDFVIDGNGGRGLARAVEGYVRVEGDGTITPTEAP